MERNYQENSCKRCGRCMTVCPLYQTTFREADVARGKLALLEMMDQDAIERSKRFRNILSRCLLCGACSAACANSVQTTDVIQRGRQHLFKIGGKGLLEHPLAKTLREGGLSGAIAPKGGALFQALCCKKIPETSGLHLRFPLSFFTQRITVPAISWTPFIKAFRNKAAKEPSNARVGLFVGCGANYLFPDASWAFVRLFQKMDIDVVVPQDQVCCGLPAFVSGDLDKARSLARQNIKAFKALNLDAVLTLCASCGSHLGKLGALFDDDHWRSQAKDLGVIHKDAMAYLIEDLDFEKFLKNHPTNSASGGNSLFRVGYHDPCHLRIGQGGTKAPRQILKALAGVELVESSHGSQCCGHGGSFNLTHFDLSMEILNRRIQCFQQVSPDAIASGCTGCLLQFAEGVARQGSAGRPVEVVHPLVIVDRWLNPKRP